MGIDAFKTDSNSNDTDENNDEKEQNETEQSIDLTDEEQALTAIDYIGTNIRDKIDGEYHNVRIENGEVKGDIDDVAKLFAVMTMDFGNADFEELTKHGK
jgi:hypothetical protein